MISIFNFTCLSHNVFQFYLLSFSYQKRTRTRNNKRNNLRGILFFVFCWRLILIFKGLVFYCINIKNIVEARFNIYKQNKSRLFSSVFSVFDCDDLTGVSFKRVDIKWNALGTYCAIFIFVSQFALSFNSLSIWL